MDAKTEQRLNQLTASEIAAAITSGRTTCEAVVRACLDRVAAREPDVQAWAYIDPDHAIAAARAFDRSGAHGPLAGVHFHAFAPAATPKEIVAMLSTELRKIIASPALKERFFAIGFDPTPLTAEETGAIMRRTGDAWAPLIKKLNIKLD